MRSAPFDQLAKRVANDVLKGVPVWIWEQLVPKDVIAFTYHIVSDEDLPHQRLYAYKNCRQFESDVIFGRDSAVSYEELARHRRGEGRMAPNRMLFTFDDGLTECFHIIRPILRKHGVPAIFFVNTTFLDDRETFFETTLSHCLGEIEKLSDEQASDIVARLELNRVDPARKVSNVELGRSRLREARVAIPDSRAHKKLVLWLLGFEEDGRAEIDRARQLLGGGAPSAPPGRRTCMTTDEVRQLAAEGFAIGSHGSSHLPLQQLSPASMEEHIVSSCQTVRAMTGQDRVPFAFPYTGMGIDRAILADIIRRNPFIDLLFDTQAFCRDSEFMVQRICADPPPIDGSSGSNLPFLMRTAWARRSAWYRAGT
jgi:peptidoglycan/xylan/chitin deacetylase (PgdA/CDA1 family)